MKIAAYRAIANEKNLLNRKMIENRASDNFIPRMSKIGPRYFCCA